MNETLNYNCQKARLTAVFNHWKERMQAVVNIWGNANPYSLAWDAVQELKNRQVKTLSGFIIEKFPDDTDKFNALLTEHRNLMNGCISFRLQPNTRSLRGCRVWKQFPCNGTNFRQPYECDRSELSKELFASLCSKNFTCENCNGFYIIYGTVYLAYCNKFSELETIIDLVYRSDALKNLTGYGGYDVLDDWIQSGIVDCDTLQEPKPDPDPSPDPSPDPNPDPNVDGENGDGGSGGGGTGNGSDTDTGTSGGTNTSTSKNNWVSLIVLIMCILFGVTIAIYLLFFRTKSPRKKTRF